MGRLEIKLLGMFSVTRDGQPITRFQSQRVRDLLSYLLLNRETVHPREYLAGLFWGDLEESNARHCLNTALWRLQRALGPPQPNSQPYLRVDAHTIGFNPASNCFLDVAEFESCCMLAEEAVLRDEDRRASLYQQAVTLYCADLLLECYDDWCLFERERLRILYLRVLGHLLTYHTVRQEYDSAIDYGLRILACDPLREEVHRDLIRLYVDAGQPTAALRQYHTCEQVLRRELGITPMPETQALVVGIRDSSRPIMLTQHRPAESLSHHTVPDLHAARVRLDELRETVERLRIELSETQAMLDDIAQQLKPDPTPARGQEAGRHRSAVLAEATCPA